MKNKITIVFIIILGAITLLSGCSSMTVSPANAVFIEEPQYTETSQIIKPQVYTIDITNPIWTDQLANYTAPPYINNLVGNNSSGASDIINSYQGMDNQTNVEISYDSKTGQGVFYTFDAYISGNINIKQVFSIQVTNNIATVTLYQPYDYQNNYYTFFQPYNEKFIAILTSCMQQTPVDSKYCGRAQNVLGTYFRY